MQAGFTPLVPFSGVPSAVTIAVAVAVAVATIATAATAAAAAVAVAGFVTAIELEE